jgi:hypothetical protein
MKCSWGVKCYGSAYTNVCTTVAVKCTYEHSSLWTIIWKEVSLLFNIIRVKQSMYSPGHALRVPGVWGYQISWQSAHEDGKVVSPRHRPLLTLRNIPGTHLCWSVSRPQGHSAAGRIKSIKISNNTIGNRTRDLPTCAAVPQSTAPRVPQYSTAMKPNRLKRAEHGVMTSSHLV